MNNAAYKVLCVNVAMLEMGEGRERDTDSDRAREYIDKAFI